MHYEAKKFHDGRTVYRIGTPSKFGSADHVPIRFQNDKGDYQYGWFPLDLWTLLPDAGPSELVQKEEVKSS